MKINTIITYYLQCVELIDFIVFADFLVNSFFSDDYGNRNKSIRKNDLID